MRIAALIAVCVAAGCDGVHTGPSTGPSLVEDGPETARDVVAYARLCKQELGLPPETLEPWSCLDGVEVPVTMEGHPLDETNYPDLAAGRAGCDRPSWLGHSFACVNYGFVQMRELAPGVYAALLCRKRSFSSPLTMPERLAAYAESGTLGDFSELYDFESLGLIWSNLETGKTCFFDFVGRLYGGYVASPDDESRPTFEDLPAPRPPPELGPETTLASVWRRNGRERWRAPAEMAASDACVQCHDSHPFKRSPWIQLAFPVPNPARDVPYIVVGKVFDAWRATRPLVAVSTTPVGGAPQMCTSCHRIGTQDTCANHIDYSIGRRWPTAVSKLAGTFPYNAWMPPLPVPDEATWHAAYDAHVSKLACCCKTPNARGCTRQPLDQSPLPEPIAGEGPESCE